MKFTRRKLATLLTATAAAVQAAPQAPAPSAAAAEPDDTTAARSALKSSLDTLAKTKIPIAVEPATYFKA